MAKKPAKDQKPKKASMPLKEKVKAGLKATLKGLTGGLKAKPAEKAKKSAESSKGAVKANEKTTEKASVKVATKGNVKAAAQGGPKQAGTVGAKPTEKATPKAKSSPKDLKSKAPEFEAEIEIEETFDAVQESFDLEAIVSAEESEAIEVVADDSDEVVLTDAEGRRYCKVKDCDQAAAVDGYCRYHYLLLWKRIQVRRKILQDGKLEKYVEDLTSRYPDKFLEMIRRDLKTEKDFLAAIAELEIDESSLESEFEDETQNYIDEVRGVSSEASLSEEEEF